MNNTSLDTPHGHDSRITAEVFEGDPQRRRVGGAQDRHARRSRDRARPASGCAVPDDVPDPSPTRCRWPEALQKSSQKTHGTGVGSGEWRGMPEDNKRVGDQC